MPQLTAADAIKIIESGENVTTRALARAAKRTLKEVASQAIEDWDTHMAAAAYKYMRRHGWTHEGSLRILADLAGVGLGVWERLHQQAADERSLDCWS